MQALNEPMDRAWRAVIEEAYRNIGKSLRPLKKPLRMNEPC
jgi:hypothetical protein